MRTFKLTAELMSGLVVVRSVRADSISEAIDRLCRSERVGNIIAVDGRTSW